MAASSVTGVGERQYLGVSHHIGPRWTQQHENTWIQLTNQFVDHASIVPPMADKVLQHSKILTILICSQILTFLMFVSLMVYCIFW